ncbi:MAG TPA: FG-GAP repeat protein [Dokdonella sp.]|nr:FG-GAP repeat protein [Dokdonella sp.]
MRVASRFHSRSFARAFALVLSLASFAAGGQAAAAEFVLREQLSAVASGEGAPGGLFGWDVAVDGDLAVACDVRLDGSPARVRTYRRSGESWQRLPAHDIALDGDSGCRLALAEGTLILSAYRAATPSRGYLRVLRFGEGGWTTEYASSSSSAYYDVVATSGDIAVAGEPLHDGAGDARGRARALRRAPDGTWSIQTLDPPSPQDGAYFGSAVAIVAGTIVVGAPGVDVVDGGTLRADAGAAYVFESILSTWNLAASLTEPAGEVGAGFRFGSAVAIGGLDPATADRLLVASPSSADANHRGVVRGYRRGASTWEPALSFSLGSGTIDDRYGCTLAMDGAWVVVGVCASASAGANAGAVRVLRFDDAFETIVASTERTDPAAAADDQFGLRVGIERDGPTVIVGNLRATLYGNEQQGVVVIGHGSNDGDVPALARSIELGQGLTGAQAGAVAVDGDALLIGAYGESVGSQHGRGAAYVYRRAADGSHAFEARLLAPDGLADDAFGFSVALHGDVALVGAVGRDLAGVEAAGAVYAFHRTAGSWVLEAVLTPDAPIDDTAMGLDVAFDGSIALIGERRSRVGVYERSSAGAWTRIQDIERNGYESIAMSGDVAALGNPAAGANDSTAGEVALYRRSGGVWQLENVIPGAGVGQQFGDEVSLDGDRLAVASNGEHVPVLMYRHGDNGWLPDGVLLPDDIGARERCHHVAVRGERVALGCWDHPADSGESAVYVYARDAGAWSFTQKLAAPGGMPYEAFGYSLAWQGSLLYAGALSRAIDFNGQGAVYEFAGDALFRSGFE